jgi:predicted O-methyltransferase YrrM
MDRSRRPHPVTLWCEHFTVDVRSYSSALDAKLASEASAYAAQLKRIGRQRLAGLPINLGMEGVRVGGPALYELLYFLVRYLRPANVVETGVAAGWSSRAILDAMRANDHGRLFSVDLPYSRLESMVGKLHISDDQVGLMVDDELRDRWTLLVGPDREQLPVALNLAGTVDLLHYDSDKDYDGRAWALKTAEPALSPDATIVMDDIRDNSFFMDYVRTRGQPFAVVNNKEGIVGPLGRVDPNVDHGVPWPPLRKGRIRGHR